MLNSELQKYLDNTKKPWGTLFYKIVWEQLPDINNLKILDFGSGFGITADHLAKNNEVIAIEPNSNMVNVRECRNDYKQIVGGIEKLKEQENSSFDVIVCHNVLEYAPERIEIMKEFSRILKKNGILSILKHNHCGRIMHKVVFENNLDEALLLADGGDIESTNFGKVNYYTNEELTRWVDNIKIEKIFGVRAFWGLQQNNDIKFETTWQNKMFEIEMKLSNVEPYKNISFFNHVLLRKL